ncbi:hypothetical protein CR513_25419, partial [Mucuna pruriens]
MQNSIISFKSLLAVKTFASNSLVSLIPASNALYSAWLLLALNSKWSDCSINTPFEPSNITPTPLPT